MILTIVLVSIGAVFFADSIFDAIKSGEKKKVVGQVEILNADVNAKKKDFPDSGFTPLTYAMYKLKGQERRDIVTYLIASKANPNGVATPDQDMYDYLHGPEETPLCAALFTGDLALITSLLDAGANPAAPVRYATGRSLRNVDGYFGPAYNANVKLRITAVDIAVLLKDPLYISLLKAKSPQLAPTYNVSSLWYLSYKNDLSGFKNALKGGAVPEAYDIAYLIHYGKKDFLSLIDALGLFSPTEGVNLSADTGDIATVSDYFDKNQISLLNDPAGFGKGLMALPVNWEKIRAWGKKPLLGDDSDNWYFDNIVTWFSDSPDTSKRYAMAAHIADIDGYFATTDDNLWFQIYESGTKFDARYQHSDEGTNQAGEVRVLDAEINGYGEWKLLCDFVGFGKYWVYPSRDTSIEMCDDPSRALSKKLYFNRWSKEIWEAQKRPNTGGR